MNNLLLLFSLLNLSAVVLGGNSNDFTHTHEHSHDIDDFNFETFGSGMGSGELSIGGLDLGHDSHFNNPISKGLPWEHDRPVFTTDDVFELQSFLLLEKIKLLEFKCIEHDYKFGYADADLEHLLVSVLRLKIELLEDPHKFTHVFLDDHTLEEILKVLEQIVELKKKLKPCLLELLFDAHGKPLFKKEALKKLEIVLLKVKIALLKNPHDHLYADYTKEYLFKLKLAVLKLQIALIHDPFLFGHNFHFNVKDLLELIVDILDIKNGFPSTHFSSIGQRISHGLKWVHDEPQFDTDDVLELTIALLKEKTELFKFDCLKHGFKFGYKDQDLEDIKLSILKLKVALLSNPHAYFPKLVLKIKVLETLLDLVEEIIKIKLNLKPCLIKLFELKFDHMGQPLFKAEVLEKLKLTLLKLKTQLLEGFAKHEFDLWTVHYLKQLQLVALKLKIAFLKNPHLFPHLDFDVDHFLELVKEITKLKEHFQPSHPTHPVIGHLNLGSGNSGNSEGEVPQIEGLSSIRPHHDDEPVHLKWGKNGFPLFSLNELVRFKNDAVDFKLELEDVLRQIEQGAMSLQIFPYTIEELLKIRENLLKLKILLIRDFSIFGGTRHRPLKGLVKIQFIVDTIDDIIMLLKKIFAPAKPYRGNGKCSDEFDQLINTWNLRLVQRDCDWECHHEERCTNKCIVRRTHLSQKCSTCFGEFARCQQKACWFRCAFQSEQSCQECADRNCTDKFERCAFGDYDFDWKIDMGFGWEWGEHTDHGRRRMPFEGMIDFTQAN